MHIYNHVSRACSAATASSAGPAGAGGGNRAKYAARTGAVALRDGAANRGTSASAEPRVAVAASGAFVCEQPVGGSTAAEVAARPDLAPLFRAPRHPGGDRTARTCWRPARSRGRRWSRARRQGPTMIEAKTFRLSARGRKPGAHRDPGQSRSGAARPAHALRAAAHRHGVMCEDEMVAMRAEVSAELDRALAQACADPFPAGGPGALTATDEAPADAPSVAKFRRVEPVLRPVADAADRPWAGWEPARGRGAAEMERRARLPHRRDLAP